MKESELKTILTNRLERERADLLEFNQLVNAGDKNKNQLNKRILKYLPEGCNYYIQYGNYHVKFPSGNDHYIGWVGSTTEITEATLRKADSCYSNGAEERIEKIERILNNPKEFFIILETHNKLQGAVKTLSDIIKSYNENEIDSFHNPVYYELMSLISKDNNIKNAITELKYYE